MDLLQANRDLISTGVKEFNVLLNQQVSPDILIQRTGLVWWVVGEGREGRIIWSWDSDGGIDRN